MSNAFIIVTVVTVVAVAAAGVVAGLFIWCCAVVKRYLVHEQEFLSGH
jgi:hypothetical protein